MNFKDLYADDNAVSPVIGVILMVAITVILAAVIGTFVLGLGDSMNQNAPTTNFAFEEADDTVKVEHTGGETIPYSNIKITVDGEKAELDGGDNWHADDDSEVTAGSTAIIDNEEEFGDDKEYTIRVVWTSDDGSTTQTLDDYTYDASS